MDVVVAVLKDLYVFAVKYKLGFSGVAAKEDRAAVAEFTKAVTRATVTAPPANTPSTALIGEPSSPPLLGGGDEERFESVGYAYAPEAFLYALPTRMFDGVIARLAYGTSFQILNHQGKWLNVLWNDTRGWMHADDVTESSASLNPRFSTGEQYDAEHASTTKLRTLIDDQFHAAALALPLQDVEYVAYKLKRKGRSVTWPKERPRIAGTWQRLLKGIVGIHIGVHPRTDAVMEYINTDGTGHVAYVQSVYPDGSLTISEVGYPTEGIYGERTLSKEEWKELRPVFIDIT